MVTEPSFSGEDFSMEDFDIDFEFDAPRFFDFTRPELDSETQELDLWFETAGNYPSSPFSPKFNWKFEPFKETTSTTTTESKPVEISKPEFSDTGLNRKDKYNGFIYYNQTVKNVSKKKTKPKPQSSSTSNSSTLTRPTASLLARQNKPLDIYSVQLLTRCQRSLSKFGDKLSPLFSNLQKKQDTKSPKHEAKAYVSRKLKLTVPKEPNLRTAERSERHREFFRSKANSETEQIAKSSSNKRRTTEKDFNLESSSTVLPKSNTPKCQGLQAFRLRTSLRAKEQHSSKAKTDVIHENDATNSKTLVHSYETNYLCRLQNIKALKSKIVKERQSDKITCQVYESKRSIEEEELGETTKINFGTQSFCRTDMKPFFDIKRSLDLCRNFDSQKPTRNLIIA